MTEQKQQRLLDADSATRKTFPMASGLLDYFPDALAYVAWVSHQGNAKHNLGEPLHHARGKSTDHADCIVRHVTRHGEFDGEVRESGALAWRALALLQEELEQAHGFPLPRGARPAQMFSPGEIVEVNARPGESFVAAANRTLAELTAVEVPDTKFGFTVGETVNVNGVKPGDNPGVVVGFADDGRIKVRWFGMPDNDFGRWRPDELRHGE